MIFLNIFLKLSIIFFLSCSSQGLKREKRLEGAAQEFGKVSEFFLPMIPTWSDFSSTGQCFRSPGIQYLNLQKINLSYGLDYNRAIELQGFYNQSLSSIEEGKETTQLERNSLFYESIEKLNGGIRYFELPDYDRFYLVWIDRMSDEQLSKWLEKYRRSTYMDQGVPVLLSFCKKKIEIEKRIEQLEFTDDFPHILSAEILSSYSKSFFASTQFFVDLTPFFPKKSEIYLVMKNDYKGPGVKEVMFAQGYKKLVYPIN